MLRGFGLLVEEAVRVVLEMGRAGDSRRWDCGRGGLVVVLGGDGLGDRRVW